ncbi:MAG: O-antigen ligase family protein [Candidatus Pacebacteria bacterium]|nr:O-antigen ligase family protein [Candidatus Paceibacterota bacterium]
MKDIAKMTVFAGLFAIPFIPLIVSDSLFFPFITGKNFTFRIIVEIIFAAWILLALYEPVYRPRFSWILGGFTAFIGVTFLANLLGEYPLKSFWSNYERMEGFMALIHTFLYMVVLGSVCTTEKLWTRYLGTILFAAALVGVVAFAQAGGFVEHRYKGFRADGTLGNATYMAVYMLFSSFLTLLLFVRMRVFQNKWAVGAFVMLLAVFVFLLFQTATRGTTLGLVGGFLVAAGCIACFAKEQRLLRKIATGVLLSIVALTGVFFLAKDSAFIQDNRYLDRIADISLEAGATRFEIWGMALEGVKERPLLGWGQGNFNYVFNTYYEPSLYDQEAWFDRVHNIVVDWLIAGGIVGFLAYAAILLAALYYLIVAPRTIGAGREVFIPTERGILVGLLAGYFFHNLFVFDNIVSYIFYAVVLAFIHAHVTADSAPKQTKPMDARLISQVVAPVVGVVLVGTVYFVNVPHIQAARDIIQAFTSQSPEAMLTEFEEALARGSFADQEIREQMMRQMGVIMRAQHVPDTFKEVFFIKTEEALLQQAIEKPNDARIHVFISSFYRTTGQLEKAVEQLAIARSLSPQKQQIIFEQALTQMQLGNASSSQALFKEAYMLETQYELARVFYAMALFQTGAADEARALIYDDAADTKRVIRTISDNNMVIQAIYAAQAYDVLTDVYASRVARKPLDPQNHVHLAVVAYEQGDSAGAIQILQDAAAQIPTFAAQAETFIEDIEAGRTPGAPRVQVDGETVDATMQ